MTTQLAYPTLTATGIKNSVASLMGSVRYIQSFVPIAVYNVLKNRVDYADKYFNKHTLGKTSYVVFSKRVPKNHPLFSIYHWTKNAMTAVEKKFLKELYLVVRDKNTKEVIEYYCFSINYIDNDGLPSGQIESTTVMERTGELFNSITNLGDQEKLNGDNISFAMQVVLNEDAPTDYITKSFSKSETVYVNPNDKNVPFSTINTGYHTLQLNGKVFSVDEDKPTECNDQSQDNQEDIDEGAKSLPFKIENIQNMYSDKQKNNDDLVNCTNNEVREIMESEVQQGTEKESDTDEVFQIKRPAPLVKRKSVKGNKGAKKGEPKKLKVEQNNNRDMEIESLDSSDFFNEIAKQENIKLIKRDNEIVCLCSLPYDIPNINKIKCTMCNKYQHVACCGHRSIAAVPNPHICYNCYKEKGVKTKDVRICNLKTPIMRFKTSIVRLVSDFCLQNDQSPQCFLNLLPADLHEYALPELLRYKLIKEENDKYIANKDKALNLVNSWVFYQKTDRMELDTCSIITLE